MTELADKLMQCYDSRELPSWYEIFDASTRLATLSRQLAEARNVPAPIGLFWLGDKHEGTGCAKDECGCVAYFNTRAECEAFMAHAAAMGAVK